MLSRTLLYTLSAAASAQATQIFSNTGTMDGWDEVIHENIGTVGEVTNVFYDGPDALKMTQTYTPGYTGRYHSEVIKYNVVNKGDMGFYGFAFRLQEDWQFDPAQGYNLAQFIADFTDLGCTETFMPATMVWIDGDQLAARVKFGDVCPQSSQQIQEFTNLATVTANGDWHKIVMQINWQSDDTGYFKLWYDGVKVTETFNIPTIVNQAAGHPLQYRVGLYANSWHDENEMLGSQPFRQVWYDQIAAGSVFADADPDQWS